MWGDNAHNKNGKTLEEALPGINGIIINNDGPTRIAERLGDSDSCIDLTVVTPTVLLELSWKLLPLMGSDHRPAISTVQHSRRNSLRTNWKCGFRYRTGGKAVVNRVRRTIKESRQKLKRKTRARPEWITPAVEIAWQKKLTAGKEYTEAKKKQLGQIEIQNRKEAYSSATKLYKDTAEEARQQVWDRFCETSDPADPTVISRFWRLAKSMGKAVRGESSGPHQITGLSGEKLTTEEEKGKAFLSRYVSQLQPNGQAAVQEVWNEVNQRIIRSNQQSQEPEITVRALQTQFGHLVVEMGLAACSAGADKGT